MKFLLLIFFTISLGYAQKAYRKTTPKQAVVKIDSTEYFAQQEVDLSLLDKYQWRRYQQELNAELDNVPTYFNIVITASDYLPRPITYRQLSIDQNGAELLETYNGNGKSSFGYGAALELSPNPMTFFRLGYDRTTMKFDLDSSGLRIRDFSTALHNINLTFLIFIGSFNIDIGDVFTFSENGFSLNMYAGAGFQLWRGISFSARYYVWGVGMLPLPSEKGYVKGMKESDLFAHVSTIPGSEFKYQHIRTVQLTLSVDLFFNARNEYSQSVKAAEYRAWRTALGGAPVEERIILPPPAPAPAPVSYSRYSDAELQKLLDEAVQKEQFDKAEQIQNEITKRSQSVQPVDFTRMSDEQLQTALKIAIQKEDYETAGKIQTEIKRRNPKK
jgi:hypothetical protein